MEIISGLGLRPQIKAAFYKYLYFTENRTIFLLFWPLFIMSIRISHVSPHVEETLARPTLCTEQSCIFSCFIWKEVLFA